jgi:hypothetical protein
MAKYDDYVSRRKREYGDRFSDAGLAPEFVRYFNSGERVKVRMGYGEEITGTIGATTGWTPCFLLMRRANSRGSSDTLGGNDHVVAVKRGREYVPVRERVGNA